MVRARIKNIDVQDTRASKNEHIPDASEITPLSLLHPIIEEREAHISKDSLCR